MIDDGHQTEIAPRSLVNFSLSKEKFPNGWNNILAKRSDKINWFGLWHCFYGLWGGISPETTMSDLKPYLMQSSNPLAKTKRKRLIVGDDDRGSKLLYEKLVNSVAQPGFDFAKIDVQTSGFVNYQGSNNPVLAHRQNAENLEALAYEKLDGIMNCMA